MRNLYKHEITFGRPTIFTMHMKLITSQDCKSYESYFFCSLHAMRCVLDHFIEMVEITIKNYLKITYIPFFALFFSE